MAQSEHHLPPLQHFGTTLACNSHSVEVCNPHEKSFTEKLAAHAFNGDYSSFDLFGFCTHAGCGSLCFWVECGV